MIIDIKIAGWTGHIQRMGNDEIIKVLCKIHHVKEGR